MTDKADTTREAVERLAESHDRLAEKGSVGMYPSWHRQRAYVLRTLAAENDALRAEVAALQHTLKIERDMCQLAIAETRKEVLEEAARLCEANEITFEIVGTGRRYVLRPRGVANTDGETYAAAIRARIDLQK